jgi:hypothetical protein
MTAKTSTERGREYRQRQRARRLLEVRGIWAPKDKHSVIKTAAREFGAEKRGVQAKGNGDAN